MRLVTNTTQSFAEGNFREKKTFSVMEKYLSNKFYIWKQACFKDFLQFFVRMELYETI